jgi:hypothetical protein
MDCPACTASLPPGSTWCPNCGGALPAAPPPRPRASADPAAAAAGKALLLSLPALCCVPFSLFGAFYAARAVSLARQYGIPVPRRAVAAWVLVAVSLLTWGVLVGSYISFQLQNRRALQAIQERLVGKRETAAIDQQTACDLVEEQLRAGLYDGWSPERVVCHGPLESGPGWALLKRVDVDTQIDHARLNACLARAQRWFALKMTSGERCPPPPPARPGLAADVEERTLRQEAAQQADGDDVAAFTSALARVKDALAAAPRAERSCPRVDVASWRGPGSEQLRLSTVDLMVLDARTEESLDGNGWRFLTSSDVGLAIEPRASANSRARAVRKMARESGPFLVVYQTDERAWPRLVDEDDENRPTVDHYGSFSGWLVVVDLAAGRPVCEAPLDFENSREFIDRTPRKRRTAAAVKDLKEQFERRAITALRGISEGQFRLGYRLVE